MTLGLISVHFPKSGGTTFAAALRSHFGDALMLDYDHAPLLVEYEKQFPLSAPPWVRAVHGHFRGDAYSRTKRVTFLREPIANLVSIFFFWRTYPASDSPVHRRFLEEKPDILAFATYPGVQRLMSESYFGGVDMKSFDFIGFYETRQKDLLRFSEQYGIAVDTELHLNRTEVQQPELCTIMSDSRIMAKLRDLLKDDINFYERECRRAGQ